MERKEPRMSVWRWDPFDELVALRESMEHLFEEMYSCRPPLFRVAPVMWETDAALVFRAELPSADPPSAAPGGRAPRHGRPRRRPPPPPGGRPRPPPPPRRTPRHEHPTAPA